MDLLPLLHIGIVLSDPLQSELVHEVDGVGCVQVSLLEGGKRGREGGRGGGGGGRREGGERGREGQRLALMMLSTLCNVPSPRTQTKQPHHYYMC